MAPRPLRLASARVRTCHDFRMQAFPHRAALLRDGRACERTVVEDSEFCVHHERLLAEHGAEALKQGLASTQAGARSLAARRSSR
jgi:hypothetical protein